MSADNDMDPGDLPTSLPELTQVEEMVVARSHVHMMVCRYRGHHYHYSGHCMSSFYGPRTASSMVARDTSDRSGPTFESAWLPSSPGCASSRRTTRTTATLPTPPPASRTASPLTKSLPLAPLYASTSPMREALWSILTLLILFVERHLQPYVESVNGLIAEVFARQRGEVLIRLKNNLITIIRLAKLADLPQGVLGLQCHSNPASHNRAPKTPHFSRIRESGAGAQVRAMNRLLDTAGVLNPFVGDQLTAIHISLEAICMSIAHVLGKELVIAAELKHWLTIAVRQIDVM